MGTSAFYSGEVCVGDHGRALVFATDDQLRLLSEASVMYMDATFRVVPPVFHQMFTVFVPYATHSFPVFFALMTRKTTELYEPVRSVEVAYTATCFSTQRT